MKCLIIGAAGFVGSYLINHLQNEKNWNVFATKLACEDFVSSGATVLDLDILDKEDIKKVFESVRPDYIFHLAAQSSVALSWEKPLLTVDVNIKGCINVLDVLKELNFKKTRVLLIGSGEEYGRVSENDVPVAESNALQPGNIYAATKICQNMIGKIYADAYGLDIMMVRAFNHIGAGQSPVFVVSDFCKQVAEIEAGKREPIIYVGNLCAKRDFTNVRDIVKAYSAVIEKGERGETYNVGSGRAESIEDILALILQMSKIKIRVEQDKAKLRPIDVPIIEADISKLQKITGWKPEIQLKDSLLEILEYWRERAR